MSSTVTQCGVVLTLEGKRCDFAPSPLHRRGVLRGGWGGDAARDVGYVCTPRCMKRSRVAAIVSMSAAAAAAKSHALDVRVKANALVPSLIPTAVHTTPHAIARRGSVGSRTSPANEMTARNSKPPAFE
jgi:hypothetical protein